MEAFNRYLQQFPHYTPRVYERALPYLSKKELKAGEYFLHLGRVCRDIAFIESGLLRLHYLNDGKEITNCFCRENSITTSYRSLTTHTESEIAIQAIEDSSLFVMPYNALQQLYMEDVFWQQVGRLEVENELFTSESHTRFLNDLPATDRYLYIIEHQSELLQRIPLNHLATYLQIAPETLSRIRKKITRT